VQSVMDIRKRKMLTEDWVRWGGRGEGVIGEHASAVCVSIGYDGGGLADF